MNDRRLRQSRSNHHTPSRPAPLTARRLAAGIVLIAIAAQILGASAAVAATLHVDARKGSLAVDGADGSREKPYRQLQEAVTAAFPGDTVLLAPGRYPGFVDVPASAAGIVIRGQGKATVEALVGGIGFCDAALDVRAAGVTVEHLDIVTTGDGIDFEAPNGLARHNTITTLTTGICTAMLDRQGGSVFEHNRAWVHAYGFYGAFTGSTVRFNHVTGLGEPNTSFLAYVGPADGVLFADNQLSGLADLGQIFGAEMEISGNHATVTAQGFSLFGTGRVTGNQIRNSGAGWDIEATGAFTFAHNRCEISSPPEACD